jgi:predicted phage baseplate assembly protein
MKKLAPNLFQQRFEDLMEIGRAQIPALAPGWTDHNAHDPGITLIELLAWVAEAQMYSLSRISRGERAAYASLMGIGASGAQGATGLIWPDREDPDSPAATYLRTSVIPEDATIRILQTENPIFTPANRLLWIPGRIEKLETRERGGRRTDHTKNNELGGSAFLAFGAGGPRDVLSMRFAARDRAGMFGASRQDALGAYWPIGFRVAPRLGGGAVPPAPGKPDRTSLTAALATRDERVALRIVSDTTEGFLRTGVVLLDLDKVSKPHTEFTVEFRAPAGFAISPRLLRVEPNVIPIHQGRTIPDEVHVSNGMPDLNFALNEPGLGFAAGEEPVRVEVLDNGRSTEWRRCDRLSAQGPNDTVYEFDAEREEITFGNGLNGAVSPPASQILVTYRVSDGEAGNTARNRKWSVTGFEGVFGINPEPISGGTEASDLRGQRRDARAKFRSDHALVTPGDIEEAAKRPPMLEVARAWVVVPGADSRQSGEVTLVVLRSRDDEQEPDQAPETARWLAAIRRSLTPRMPLGTRLIVNRPHYSDFRIGAKVEVVNGFDPDVVRKEIEQRLREKLTLIGPEERQPGAAVSGRDVSGWIRGVDGVRRVTEVLLRDAEGKVTDPIGVRRGGLPRWKVNESTIQVTRAGMGGRNEQ